ncbi:MAG: ATP-dependent DNA helicase RecG [Clostridiales bacterium]|nr:ATP-dependent DNA helicase RecG [Clostridiales bacterium]
MELSALHGIGKKRLDSLHAAGIISLRDLLFAVPQKYRDASAAVKVAEARAGERQCFSLLRLGEAKLARFKGKLTRVTCTFVDDSGMIAGCWFNQPWMKENLNRGTRFLLYGLVENRGGKMQLMNASLEKENRIVPIYRPIEGVSQRVHETIVREALEKVEELCPETLPESLLQEYGLWGLSRAIRCLHAPESMEDVAQARRRFAFEQMLIYQVSVRMVRQLRRSGMPLNCPMEKQNAFWDSMPFRPTEAQQRTLAEIAADMEKDRAMARMVQGDVGSGKTAVAMGAMLLCAENGCQSALMAPTEILARQHYESMRGFFQSKGFTCGLLTGAMPAAERRAALRAIEDGSWQIVVGTHALIGKTVKFARLRLCITDEQHRFGVAQRTALLEKGEEQENSPHLLVMSATPIPRSLALIMFGDLDLSIIDQLPPGRTPVKTRIVPDGKREDMYGFLRKELDEGRQAYIVCPLVEDSEEGDSLRSVKKHAMELTSGELKDYSLGLTYGTQSLLEKQETLRAFAAGELQVLVATTVIEVGVNVPNASVMIIEDADRYGLAQLHQLRGRVGRGSNQSWCFLLAQPNERLRALVSTGDGFEIARADLEQRGPGELLGTRQHGESLLPGGRAAYGTMQDLYEASQCAETLCTDPARKREWEMVSELAKDVIRQLNSRVSIS